MDVQDIIINTESKKKKKENEKILVQGERLT